MFKDLTARGKIILSLILILIVCIAGYFAYQYFHPAQPVTALSQQQAETPAGVSLAAHNAKVGLVQDQLNEASRQIALLKNKPPDTVYHPVPYEVPRIIEVERQSRGADFAIITDPKNPSKVVDLKEITKLPADTPITLNQYNVMAYKKIIRDVTAYPSFKGAGVDEVDIGISRKITNNGLYVGVVAGYEFDDKKAKIGLRVTF